MKKEFSRTLEALLKYYFYTNTQKYEKVKKMLIEANVSIRYSKTRIDLFRSFSLPTMLPFGIFSMKKDISDQKKEILESYEKIRLELENFLRDDSLDDKTKNIIQNLLNE